MTNRFGSVPVGDGSGAESLRSNLEAGASIGDRDAGRPKSAEQSLGTFTTKQSEQEEKQTLLPSGSAVNQGEWSGGRRRFEEPATRTAAFRSGTEHRTISNAFRTSGMSLRMSEGLPKAHGANPN
nr:hypothetical protein [Treponema sp.]